MSHNLYQPEELKKVQTQVESEKGLSSDDSEGESADAGSPVAGGLSKTGMADRLQKLEEQMQSVFQRLSALES